MKKGLIHIYTGDGKGKTTAAAGLAYRAKGAGLKVCFLQLFKSGECNESKFFEDDEFVREDLSKFSREMTQSEIEEYGKKAVNSVKNTLLADYDLLVIDEFFMLLSLNILTDSMALDLIKSKTSKTELVLTGRNAPKMLIDAAHYVSEIQCIKHPFNDGVKCRKGIEY